ncbi:MAG: hypothetical protein PF439_11275 [Helicobacteraceae bacterium]|nr:hypothetical protein [Helicobacteraceae bacterium]
MNLGFRSKAKAFFVDVDSPDYPLEGAVNIILSPSMYWVKRVTLPVKYLYEVKTLIPSLFEDNLPEGKYSYSTYKDGDSFLIFAYNDKEVLDLIAEKGITSANINNIYLAQSEFDTIDTPINISKNSVIGLKNGVVVKLPSALAPDAATLDLDKHTFSKHTIHLTRFNQIADKKSQKVFATIFGFLIVMFATEWLITSSQVSAISEKESEVFSRHNLPSTSFQNEAIHAKLNTTFERQSRIREILNLALTITLKPQEKLEHISLEKSSVIIEIRTDSESTGAQSLSTLKQQLKRTTVRYKDGIYTMEIQL